MKAKNIIYLQIQSLEGNTQTLSISILHLQIDAVTRNQGTYRIAEGDSNKKLGQDTEHLLESVLEEGKRRGRRKEVGRSLRKTMRIP